jgi:DNA mismatch repair protein MutS2
VHEREATVAEREEKVRRRLRELDVGAATAFTEKLRAAEHEIARVVAELQRDRTSQGASSAREEVEALAAVLDEMAPSPSVPRGDSGVLEVGATVRVPALGLSGEVIALREREVEVRARGMTLKLRPSEVVVAGDASTTPMRPRVPARPASSNAASPASALRTEANTLDLRGARVAEGLAALEGFLDAAVLGGADAVFVLHGHGTGVLKTAVRKALADSHYVAASAPALPEQGGDGFTVAILK